jgi:hypothetical protein
MIFNLKVIGVLLIVLALIHAVFPRYFNWAKDLQAISLINRQLIHIHTFFIALALLLMGVLCLTSADELVNTSLGSRITLGFGIFWAVRLIVQFFGYSSKLWRGKVFETTMHILFSILWAYLSVSFVCAYWLSIK